MKRSRYYVLACIAGLILSFIGLIGANSDVSLKDLVTLNFIFDIPRIKEILTNIFSTMIVFSATLFFFAIGFAKKQREDVSQIKKYALYELLLSVKMQHSQLVDYPPIDEPADLFCAYVHNVYEVRAACDKVLAAYENLLTTWEQETLKNLQHSAMVLSEDFGISAENFREYPIILRYDKKAKVGFQHDCDVSNYGGSKGATYERVVIIPVSTTLPFIERQVKIMSNQTRAKFYVACTRAKHSVVFAMENPCENGVFKATDIHFSDKSIPAYKFSKPDSDI